jgi:hypothetical protein
MTVVGRGRGAPEATAVLAAKRERGHLLVRLAGTVDSFTSGLGAAIAWGALDFSGALAQRRLGKLSTAPSMIRASAAVLTATPVAGMARSVGVVLLYRAFAVGRIRILAPVSATITRLFPITVGLLSGERLDTISTWGVGLCFVAAVLFLMPGVP